ncbi:MAG: hypothetical protein FWF51_08320 [Chitinivibrionia bacterium]|nr:hypothetical protein [Chitinivibrionia bacterium]
MEKYKELEDTVAEVYRKRESIMKEFNYDPKAYHKYLRETKYEVEKAGFRYFTETELAGLRKSHSRDNKKVK